MQRSTMLYTKHMSTDGCRVIPSPKLHETDRTVQSEVALLNDTSLLRMQLLAREGLHASAEIYRQSDSVR